LGLMLDFFVDEIKELSGLPTTLNAFTYKTDGRITVKQLGEMEPGVPTGESMTYIIAGSGAILLAAAALLVVRKRKVADS
ncbi:MAG TPA: LPXTG cell wall anchor domain-containing protein, partial [Clostridia bacterium]|nr:LPXTG cell wall anchor domain-containing protein [Clostridia bacterium]